MLKDNWTTFLKARLNCSLPGDYPFYFDEIQGMAYNEEEKVVYATFNTPRYALFYLLRSNFVYNLTVDLDKTKHFFNYRNSIPGSAICSFNMSAIEDAFEGPFKHQDNPSAAWERDFSQNRNHFECEAASQTRQLLDSSRYQLMDLAVQPVTPKPLYSANLETLTHIAVDALPTKLHT